MMKPAHTLQHSLIKLKVHPDSKESVAKKRAEDSYELWVRAPAKEGRANEAALRLLAHALNQDLRRLRIIRGTTTPNKIVQVFASGGS